MHSTTFWSPHMSLTRGVKHTPSYQCPITLQIIEMAAPEPISIPRHRQRFHLFPSAPMRHIDRYNRLSCCTVEASQPVSVTEQF